MKKFLFGFGLGVLLGGAPSVYLYVKSEKRAKEDREYINYLQEQRTKNMMSEETKKLQKEKPNLELLVGEKGYSIIQIDQLPDFDNQIGRIDRENVISEYNDIINVEEYSEDEYIEEDEEEYIESQGCIIEKDEYDDGEEDVYLIDQHTMFSTKKNYDKIAWYYFEEDDILTDERNEIIFEPHIYIGWDALLNFDDKNTKIYVRNNTMECDFEILVMEGHYYGQYNEWEKETRKETKEGGE